MQLLKKRKLKEKVRHQNFIYNSKTIHEKINRKKMHTEEDIPKNSLQSQGQLLIIFTSC